jgi:signal transduction histidine kinase
MDRKKKIAIGVLLLSVAAGLLVMVLRNRMAAHSVVGRTNASGPVYTLVPPFESDQLNTRMWISYDFRFDQTDSLTQLLPAIRRRFRPNVGPSTVAHGNAAYVPVGWAFVELRNPSSQTQKLVLSMPHYRCNQATLFVGRNNYFDLVGTVRNTTPLGNRFFPVLNLAFPVSLPPRATLPLLLRTESRVGFHEVDVRLSRQDSYFQTAFIDSIRDGAQVIICFMLALVALLIGWRSANRLMFTFGGYMLFLSGAFSCLFGYLFFFPYPAWTSINTATLGTLFRMGASITIHPFLYEVVKPAIRNRRRYKLLVTGFCAVTAFFIGLHLMPYQYYGHVNYLVNMAMTYLDIVNLCWIFYFSVLAWYRAGIWSMLLICLMLFVPVAARQLLLLVQSPEGQDSFRTPIAHPTIIIIVLSYLTFEQFRRQLVTRQLLQSQVLQTQETINILRRQEIEGIGRNLHDQVGNTLATVLSYLGRIPVDTEKLRFIIVSAINELRFMSHNLVKDDERPLSEKVDTLVSRFNDFASIQLSYIDYTYRQIDQLSPLKQQNMYSIIQELLTNVIRHSKATQAYVQFFCDGTTVDITVEDDGIGFDTSTEKSSGIGIQNIYKRAALSGIEVRFDAAPTGTTVLLKTPLNENDTNPHHSH